MTRELTARHPDRPPTHPGALLREDVLPAFEISITELARHLRVTRQQVHRLLSEQAGISTEMAFRIGKLCGNGPDLWINMQKNYDMWQVRQKLRHEIEAIPTLKPAAATPQSGAVMLKVYCDTNTLAPNIRDDAPELAALERLRDLHRAGKISMYRSRSVEGEAERTPDPEQRERLRVDFELLDKVLKDEKVLGFYTQYDHAGGAITNPLVSDVQDEKMYGEIYEKHKHHSRKTHEASRRGDAVSLTQAICNDCDVFLTRDYKSIIKPLGQWLEHQYGLRVRRPSELVAEIEVVNAEPRPR